MIPSGAVPAVFTADAAVIGGSFAGVAAALRLAAGGMWTVLVEPRTYMGREATATLRPWLAADGTDGGLPPPVRRLLDAHGRGHGSALRSC